MITAILQAIVIYSDILFGALVKDTQRLLLGSFFFVKFRNSINK